MRLLFLVTMFLALSVNSAVATTFNVTLSSDLPDAIPGDGKCSYLAAPPPGQPVCTLRAAVMEANANNEADTILLQNGVTYPLTIAGANEDLAATGDLDIRKPVTISAGVFGHARIHAAVVDRVIHVLANNVSLYGLDITGGSLVGNNPCNVGGAGIDGPFVQNLQLTFVRVYQNTEGCPGYGVVGVSNGTAKLLYTEVFDNQGLGVAVSQSNLELDKSSVHDNSGIGVSAEYSSLLTLSNSTVSAGSASFGVYVNNNTTMTVSNSTFVAEQGAKALGAFNQSPLFMTNSIVIGPCDIGNDNLQGLILYDNLYNTLGCPSAGPDDNSLRNQKVFLSPLGYHDGFTPSYRPLTVSPAIDHTTGTVCDDDAYDQRGKTRKVAFKGGEAKCDIGAVELESDVIYFDSLEWF